MEFKITNNLTTETLWNSSSRITSPSIVCSKTVLLIIVKHS